MPRFDEANEEISVATIASSQCQYGDYARPPPFGQPHTIANGYATGPRARLMSL